jgi:hypothetical protein
MHTKAMDLLFLSICGIIWWASIWGLFEEAIHLVTKGRSGLRYSIYALCITLIFFTLYFHPEVLERF